MSALAAEYGAVNLGQGFPDFDPPEDLLSRVVNEISSHGHQYAPMPGYVPLREAIAAKIFSMYGRDVDPASEVTITAGATQALFTSIMALVHPGDEVIIFEPAYDSYRPSIELAGGKAVPVRLEPPDFRINWGLVAASVNDRTKMIIINTPHNPTATILGTEDMVRLSAIVKERDIVVLSDEVYEHLVFDGSDHQSVLRYPELYARSIAVFSFGKTYHSTGWKIGYCVAPPWLTAEIRKVHQWNVFSVNSFLQQALAGFLKNEEHYLTLGQFYSQKRDLFLQQLEGSGFTPLKCEGTFFQLCSYEGISDKPDKDFCREMVTKHGVAAIPLSVFYTDPQEIRLIRFCFAKKETTLRFAGQRLRSVK